MQQKGLNLILYLIVFLWSGLSYAKYNDCDDYFSDPSSLEEDMEAVYDHEYEVLYGKKNKDVRPDRRVRLNNLGQIIQELIDIYNTKYFDSLNQNESMSYLPHGQYISYEDIQTVMKKTDYMLKGFCEHILLGEDELDEYELLQKDPTHKDMRIQRHRLEMNPNITMIIVFAILKKIGSYPQLWSAYIEDEGEIYDVISYFNPKVKYSKNTITFDDPRMQKYLPQSLKKRLVSSVLLYYSQEFKNDPKYHTSELVRIGDEVVSVEDLLNLDIEKKKIQYQIRSSGISRMKRIYAQESSSREVFDNVDTNYILKTIRRMKTFTKASVWNPHIQEQDISFLFKFFRYSVHYTDFMKEVDQIFVGENKKFIKAMVEKSDFFDLDQMYYIGQNEFSIGQIFQILAANKNNSWSPNAIMNMFLSLYGGGLGVDRIRLAVNLEMLFQHKYGGRFIKSIKEGMNILKVDDAVDILDLNKAILDSLSDETTLQVLSSKEGLFIEDDSIESFNRTLKESIKEKKGNDEIIYEDFDEDEFDLDFDEEGLIFEEEEYIVDEDFE